MKFNQKEKNKILELIKDIYECNNQLLENKSIYYVLSDKESKKLIKQNEKLKKKYEFIKKQKEFELDTEKADNEELLWLISELLIFEMEDIL